jgi:hypothetical protein
MREIKFRVWNGAQMLYIKHGADLQLNFGMNDGWSLWDPYEELCDHNQGELMQYTGLTDRNGKEIFEGDIVEHRSIGGIDKGPWIGEVTIHPAQGVKVGAWPISFDYAVIGNIYEHPELLKG